jgi:hypothetical protein
MKKILLVAVAVLLAAGGIFADTETVTPTVTATVTETTTDTITVTVTVTPTVTETVSFTFTPTYTGTPADTKTVTETITPSPTATFSLTRTMTRTITDTATFTATRTYTPTSSITATVTETSTRSATPTITVTSTVTVTLTPYIIPTIPADMYELLKNKLYPNPAKAGDRIYYLTNAGSMGSRDTVIFYSLDGRQVFGAGYLSESISDNVQVPVSTSGLAPGVYFYKIIHTHQDGRKESSKIMKLVLTR